jgi:hypothetical protein
MKHILVSCAKIYSYFAAILKFACQTENIPLNSQSKSINVHTTTVRIPTSVSSSYIPL